MVKREIIRAAILLTIGLILAILLVLRYNISGWLLLILPIYSFGFGYGIKTIAIWLWGVLKLVFANTLLSIIAKSLVGLAAVLILLLFGSTLVLVIGAIVGYVRFGILLHEDIKIDRELYIDEEMI